MAASARWSPTGSSGRARRSSLIEDSEKRVAAAHAAGIEVVVGNAAERQGAGARQCRGARGRCSSPSPMPSRPGRRSSRRTSSTPTLQIIARAHSDEEVTYLRDLGANEVIMGEREIGLGMLGWTNGATPARGQRRADAGRHGRHRGGARSVAGRSGGAPRPCRPSRRRPSRWSADEPTVPAEVLEAAIEAAHPEHVIEGPAEPFAAVPALGEMPSRMRRWPSPLPRAGRCHRDGAAIQPSSRVRGSAEPSRRSRSALQPVAPEPRSTAAPAEAVGAGQHPGAAFNPEVEPVED